MGTTGYSQGWVLTGYSHGYLQDTHRVPTGYSQGTHRVLTGCDTGVLTGLGTLRDTHRVDIHRGTFIVCVLTGYSELLTGVLTGVGTLRDEQSWGSYLSH